MDEPAPATRFALRLARVLAADPQLASDFYLNASELVADFDEWGHVLQSNEAGVYDDSTAIERLRAARDLIEVRLAESR